MNNSFKRLTFVMLIFTLFLFTQCAEKQTNDSAAITKIAIINPNVWYLKSLTQLIKQNIIDIPNLELNVIIYSKTKRDIESLKSFIEKEDNVNISIQKIECNLDKAELFQKNSCSEKFYEIFKATKGILFLGGDDISPAVYEQKMRISTETTDLYRHYFELSFLFHLIGGGQNSEFKPFLEENKDYLVYGFCLGMQTMNVAGGGTMYQDIPKDVYNIDYAEDILKLNINEQHKNYWYKLFPLADIRRVNFHRIKFMDDNFLVQELGVESKMLPNVCSSHHQAVKMLGKGYKVIATSLDGRIIEAIKHEKYKNVLGVQFHPEFYDLYNLQAKKYKFAINDTLKQSYNDIIKRDKSLLFHKKFWNRFNTCF